jgi:transposase
MRSNLFWLSDEQWAGIEPHLPRDVPGVDRVDDRRVISGIVHVLRAAVAGAIARPNMVHCLVPRNRGALYDDLRRDELWGKFFTVAPQRLRRSVEQYRIVKRA